MMGIIISRLLCQIKDAKSKGIRTYVVIGEGGNAHIVYLPPMGGVSRKMYDPMRSCLPSCSVMWRYGHLGMCCEVPE